MEDNNIDDIDDNSCILRRELNINGKSRCFINDTPVNLNLLKEIGTLLIDIHSQHQNLLLEILIFKRHIGFVCPKYVSPQAIRNGLQFIYKTIEFIQPKYRRSKDTITRI